MLWRFHFKSRNLVLRLSLPPFAAALCAVFANLPLSEYILLESSVALRSRRSNARLRRTSLRINETLGILPLLRLRRWPMASIKTRSSSWDHFLYFLRLMASSPAPLSEETDAGEDERRRRAALLVPPVSVEAETGERAGEDGRPRRTALHRRRLVAPPLVSVDDAAPRERTTDEDGRRRRATLVAGGLLVASSLSDDDEMSMTECTLEPEWKDAMAGKDCGRMGWDGRPRSV